MRGIDLSQASTNNKLMNNRRRIITGLAGVIVLACSSTQTMAEDKPSGPEGLVGFSGQVRGVVVKKRDKNTIDFKVGRILKTWKNNKAKQPEALKGRTVPVGPAWVREGEGGKWHPVEKHVRFLRTLKPGEELTLELRHAEREHFAILELSGEQRERAARGDKEHPEGKEKDGRKAEIEELRRELERLKAENRELRKEREERKER